jgi:carboxymethylenebutenolidase
MSILDPLKMNRRTFMTSSVGYAVAVSPVSAWAVSTPTTDLKTGEVNIPTGSGGKESMSAYWAMPKKKGPRSGCVIVVHEIFGVHEYIKDVCRRLAQEGYFAVSPYLYFRQGDATKIADIDELRTKIISKVSQSQYLDDLDATVEWLKKNKDADASKIGITGFCWGGNATWMYAARNKSLKAGVAWYGKLVGEATPNAPKFPIDVVKDLTVPVLGLYGEKDKGIPQDTVEKMRAALKQAKSKSEIIVYPGADHGFHADYRPMYDEKSAKDGWNKLLAWFKTNGLA